ncbi:flavin reductase (DIM6/NTAB) family NADH-FMN oxidoreductase RutF [Streptomyces sp. V4I23]|uniref:flavin reductase family protein n=1 Tax=Streptomyces sp. V4I23 TaxID=3042282 RepID=UPI0027840932|nr:flavin reductase family protein [Streptomyces sp. V4I23]MDQ1012355.1 flavin reductase (DIM6/NTAB) family NADH-FMN oxidoreductase RutF [Streptomyces sp. V4I23]
MTAPTDLGTSPLTSSSALAVPRPGSAAGLGRAQQSPAGRRAASPASPAADELLKSVFRQHAAGVAVITAQGERPVGFTATSLTSVAADPPLISFGVGTGSSSWPVVAEAEYVGVHILGEHQQELAATFARSGADRFAPPTRWRTGPEGVPVLEGVVAWLVARVVARVPAGDHRLVIAEVVTGDPAGGGRPLLYHRGRFTALRD